MFDLLYRQTLKFVFCRASTDLRHSHFLPVLSGRLGWSRGGGTLVSNSSSITTLRRRCFSFCTYTEAWLRFCPLGSGVSLCSGTHRSPSRVPSYPVPSPDPPPVHVQDRGVPSASVGSRGMFVSPSYRLTSGSDLESSGTRTLVLPGLVRFGRSLVDLKEVPRTVLVYLHGRRWTPGPLV